jgi:hypothetical protein
MSTATRTRRSELTSYEAEQVRRIAAWKSEPPHPLSELWKRAALPAARAVERIIPDRAVAAAIAKAYDASGVLADSEDVRRRAGVRALADLAQGPLERSDRLAREVGASARTIGAVEGAATGAGGLFTTFLDVPLLFVLGLRAVRKVGHCYGYPLEHHHDRHFVLGVMATALAGSLEVRRERIHRLRELEELLIEETQEDILVEEALSFLFQLEIFVEIPGVGVLSGAALNWWFMRRVVETARMVFQERRLRDNGKVEYIEPAEAHARHLAGGWSGALGRAVYGGGYVLGFGLALPAYAAASLVRPIQKNPLVRGLRDGAAAATEQVDRIAVWAGGATSTSVEGQEPPPALAPA